MPRLKIRFFSSGGFVISDADVWCQVSVRVYETDFCASVFLSASVIQVKTANSSVSIFLWDSVI